MLAPGAEDLQCELPLDNRAAAPRRLQTKVSPPLCRGESCRIAAIWKSNGVAPLRTRDFVRSPTLYLTLHRLVASSFARHRIDRTRVKYYTA